MVNQYSRRRKYPPPPGPKTWECRYSSSEMLYLEMTDTGVKQYLHHSPHHAEHFTFAEILAGRIDADTRNLFGEDALNELKAEVRRKTGESNAQPE